MSSSSPPPARDARTPVSFRISADTRQQLAEISERLGCMPSDALAYAVDFAADRMEQPAYTVESRILLQEVLALEQRIELLVLGNLELAELIRLKESSAYGALIEAARYLKNRLPS